MRASRSSPANMLACSRRLRNVTCSACETRRANRPEQSFHFPPPNRSLRGPAPLADDTCMLFVPEASRGRTPALGGIPGRPQERNDGDRRSPDPVRRRPSLGVSRRSPHQCPLGGSFQHERIADGVIRRSGWNDREANSIGLIAYSDEPTGSIREVF